MDWWQTLEAGAALAVAAVLGGLMGLERELKHRWAGLRTHMLVSLGTCLFVLLGIASSSEQDQATVLSRVIQGICAGIGFIGAGAVLKLTDKMEIRGLTTASSVWTAAAIGAACGTRHFELAIMGTFLALVVLVAFRFVESWLSPPLQQPSPPNEKSGGQRSRLNRRRKKKMQEGLDKTNRSQDPQ